MDWRDSLRAELPEMHPDFRHELSFVSVSDIAQQFYCEAKVDQEYLRGEVPSEVKDTGTEMHEEILAMEPVGREELIEQIGRAPTVAATFRLYGEVGDLRVIGIPDAVIFEKGRPRWLIELKTTRGDHTRLWNDQLLQVRLYGLLLEKMGFDCSNLDLVLVRMRQDTPIDEEDRKAMLALIRTALRNERVRDLEQRSQMKFFVNRHDPRQAEGPVLWAQDYWLRRREPIPTTNQSKCRICEYNHLCPHSLWKQQLS